MTEGTIARVTVSVADIASVHGFGSDGIAALFSVSVLFSQQYLPLS